MARNVGCEVPAPALPVIVETLPALSPQSPPLQPERARSSSSDGAIRVAYHRSL
jgi:hypothetical protein